MSCPHKLTKAYYKRGTHHSKSRHDIKERLVIKKKKKVSKTKNELERMEIKNMQMQKEIQETTFEK